ncbi:hypothetical protein DFP72DRAFT_861478 [Ephemerocybe angulata]|uniref:Uncharacterized protein n=1 Tax=Ephemerocybe angulata TaxID=980116 RepID=A0A8H6H8C8_9AGAR|nr:hypothetical protein DFP72DRAFT_861478 [Tulosesus angulatus]
MPDGLLTPTRFTQRLTLFDPASNALIPRTSSEPRPIEHDDDDEARDNDTDIEDADDNDDGLDEEEAEEGSSTCTHQAHQLPPPLAARTACVLSVDTGPSLQRKRFFIAGVAQGVLEASVAQGALEAGVAQGCVAAFVDVMGRARTRFANASGAASPESCLPVARRAGRRESQSRAEYAVVVLCAGCEWTSEAKAGEEYNHGVELPRAKTTYAVVPSVIGSMSEMDDGPIFGLCCTESRGLGVGGQPGAGCMTVHIQTSDLEQLLCMCGGEDEELAVGMSSSSYVEPGQNLGVVDVVGFSAV